MWSEGWDPVKRVGGHGLDSANKTENQQVREKDPESPLHPLLTAFGYSTPVHLTMAFSLIYIHTHTQNFHEGNRPRALRTVLGTQCTLIKEPAPFRASSSQASQSGNRWLPGLATHNSHAHILFSLKG